MFAQDTISVEKLLGDIKRVEAELRATALPPQPEIIVSDAAMKETDERLFPASKNRSRRIHKKLLRRFGGEFRKEPAVFKMGDYIRDKSWVEAGSPIAYRPVGESPCSHKDRKGAR